MMKKSKCVLISNIIGSLYLLYLVVHFILSPAGTSDVWGSLAAGIAARLVMPHIMMTAIGVIFGWVGWNINKKWAVIVSICGYAFAALSFTLYAAFVLVQIILNVIACFQIKTVHTPSDDDIDLDFDEDDLTKSNFCAYCGKKRGSMQTFTKYGFCPECNTTVRTRIKSTLKLVQDGIESCNPNTQPSISPATATEEINKLLKMLDNLESEREKVPFFKSSTQEYRDTLESLMQFYQAKV